MFSLGNFSFGSSAWKLSLGILALETSACAQDLLLGTFRKGTFALDRSLGIRRLESFGWDRSLWNLLCNVSLEILRLGTCALYLEDAHLPPVSYTHLTLPTILRV